MANDTANATITDLAKRAERSLFGRYRAKVVDNADPKKRGRLKLTIPSVFGTQPTDWVPGAFPLASPAEAWLVVPEIGSHVLAEFVEGDRSAPIWTAAYLPEASDPTADHDLDQGTMHLIRSRSGVAVRIEDDGDQNFVIAVIHPGGGELRIDAEGIVTVKDEGGAQITMDPTANVTEVKGHGSQGGSLRMEDTKTVLAHGSVSIELGAGGITATGPTTTLDSDLVKLGKGAASPILDGMKFAGFYDAHAHAPPVGGIPAAPLNAALMGMKLTKVLGA
jgi:hypothetical protein